MHIATSLTHLNNVLNDLSDLEERVRYFKPSYRQIVDMVEELESCLLLEKGEEFNFSKANVPKNSPMWFALKNKDRIHEIWEELGDMAHEVEALTALVARVAFLTMDEKGRAH